MSELNLLQIKWFTHTKIPTNCLDNLKVKVNVLMSDILSVVDSSFNQVGSLLPGIKGTDPLLSGKSIPKLELPIHILGPTTSQQSVDYDCFSCIYYWEKKKSPYKWVCLNLC